MNNDKKPSRKHDWTSTELHLIALCIQCFALAVQVSTLVLQIVNLVRKLRG